MSSPQLILASGSPRRREILTEMGMEYTVDVPNVDETCFLPPREAVREISQRKAMACFRRNPGKVVIAADTLVSLNDEAYGKPHDKADAARMLRHLSGNTHQVYTGITVVSTDGKTDTRVVCTDVHFLPMTDEEITEYADSGEPMDKAGAYAIQGIASKWIEGISGSFSNVMGLPKETAMEMLRECGIKPIE